MQNFLIKILSQNAWKTLVPTLRIKTPSSVAWSAILILSPSIAPPENGLVGSIATTPTVLPILLYFAISLSVMVDLPAPGAPVIWILLQ